MNPAGVRPPSGAQSVVTPSYLPPPISQSSPGGLAPSLEEILLSMPNPRHRQVISDLRSNNIELQRYVTELQGELSTLRNRCASLESQVQESHEKPVSLPAPVKSLEDLISGLRQQFLQRIETIRRTGAEDVRNADDSSFDAPLVVHQTLSKTMRPIPKSFEFIDLMALRDSLQQEGTAPNGPLQAPLIVEFVSHLDAVRQCTRDGRIAHMHRDPIKQDTLRRLFDACKSVEAKVSNPQHLALPPQSISIDYTAIAPTDVLARRTKEFHSHTESIEKCGEIFELACRDDCLTRVRVWRRRSATHSILLCLPRVSRLTTRQLRQRMFSPGGQRSSTLTRSLSKSVEKFSSLLAEMYDPLMNNSIKWFICLHLSRSSTF
ncbi:unnamed protein product [Bodo saltans]|uniref:Uncharacterized protein n=1 Tax=Bodo saltans TaxID=75058 RepID=A0A0S4JQB9_BODSA|nr:unnamed protein product [Bodo saltans]|eukprot:CUG92158.1 unnamed protein product [Bodo saltans]